MEPVRKRQRFHSPIRQEYSRSYDNQHAYFHDELAESEEYEEVEEEDEPIADPDTELEQRRARLDYKLKSTFEAIFEKYGKDFDGVGDEIDLATGDILVNNGHLFEMQDERDAGGVRHGRRYDPREDTTESEEGFSSSVVDDEDIQEDDDNEDDEDEAASDEDSEESDDALGEEDMIEDDLILRGFAQASQFIQPEPAAGPSHAAPRSRKDTQRSQTSRQSIPIKQFPSREEILAKFGPQFGPDIIELVSHQKVSNGEDIEPAWSVPNIPALGFNRPERNIEPAWRVPEIPTAAPRKRTILKTVILQPEIERSPSPDASRSIWAPSGQRRSKSRKTTTANGGMFTREATDSRPSHRSLPGIGMGVHTHREKRERNNFTAEDDEIMLERVARARKHGSGLPISLWEDLAAQYPRHPWNSWRQRYYKHHTYFEPNVAEESELSTTEASEDVDQFMDHRKPKPVTGEKFDHRPVQISNYQRPVRIRKPAQRDSRIISWSEAVDTIKSLDPVLHAGMRDDARHRLDEGSWAFDRLGSSSTQHVQTRRASDHGQKFRPSDSELENEELSQEPRRRSSDIPPNTHNQEYRSSKPMNAPSRKDQDDLITSAPCPHADCKLYTNKFYSLRRTADEEESQMLLHLQRVHHTTPYPCGEDGCSHRGEHGYFMSTDLVRHVKSDHPHKGALHRLRGRVDSHLFEKNFELGPAHELSSKPLSPSNTRPVSRQRDSDFMSPQRVQSNRVASSRPFSRSSDLDRTLTPGGTTGASTHTPMTSVSSLMVNHPSAKMSSIGVGKSQEVLMSGGLGFDDENHPRSSMFVESKTDEHQKEWHNAASPELGGDERGIMGGRGVSVLGRPYSELVSPPITQSSSSPQPRLSLPASIPNSQSSADDKPSSSGQADIPAIPTGQTGLPFQNVSRKPDQVSAPRSINKSSMLPPRIPLTAQPQDLTTPFKRRKPRKSKGYNVFDDDELSLGTDGFLLLSSRPRTTRPSLELPIRIKREETPQAGSSGAARPKRKLRDFQSSDEIDELMADEPNFSVSQLPKVKTEVGTEEPVAVPALFKQAQVRAKKLKRPKKSSLSNSTFPDFPAAQASRASTPLLDLTPKGSKSNGPRNMQEIAASDQDSSSPPAAIHTPVKNKHLAAAEGPAVVVRTPGGTYRRCGVDGFACKRTFCFPCTTKVVATSDV